MNKGFRSRITIDGVSKKDPFYNLYTGIRRRIFDKKSKDYSRYGGKGLTFDWKNYSDFKADMYESYIAHCKKHGKNNTSIDRIDGTKGYSKENCRWATISEQAKNRNTNRYFTYNGKTMIIADWAREIGCSRQALRYRLENGLTIEEAIKIPFNHSNKYGKAL